MFKSLPPLVGEEVAVFVPMIVAGGAPEVVNNVEDEVVMAVALRVEEDLEFEDIEDIEEAKDKLEPDDIEEPELVELIDEPDEEPDDPEALSLSALN
jgi:hypothetical protein